MATDTFAASSPTVIGSPRNAVAVDVSEVDVDLEFVTTCLNVAAAGTVKVDLVDGGGTVTYYVAAGVQFPCRVEKIYHEGTSATGIIASW